MKPLAKAGNAYAIYNMRALAFRNVIHVTSLLLACLAIIVGIVGALWPNVFDPCPPTLPGLACPSGTHRTGVDIFLVELFGLIGAALVGAVAVRRMRGPSNQYALPMAALLLKLPTGALTAFLGVLVIRGGFLGTAIASSSYSLQVLLAYALIFGAAQQLFTGVVDRQVTTFSTPFG